MVQMPESGLNTLLCRQDLAEQVAKRLPLRSLAALAATSRALCQAVALLTEETWQRSAQTVHPREHPVHRAACVRDYRRSQHTLHTTLAAGSWKQEEAVTAPGVLSANLKLHATLISLGQEVSLPVCVLQLLQPQQLSARLDCRERSCRLLSSPLRLCSSDCVCPPAWRTGTAASPV